MKDKFYIYIYLDQRKQGRWKFKNKTFNFQPFYVGRGKYNRINHHLQPKSRSDNSIKSNIINLIESETGELPIHYKIFENLNFDNANIIEIAMIKQFGRIDIKTGILANMTNGGEGFKNVLFTEETRKKMSESKQGKAIGKNSAKSKIVIQYDLNGNILREWESLSDITRETGISLKGVSACCRGKCKTFKGFVWKYNGKSAYEPIIKPESPDRRKKVYQYDMEGTYIQEWISASNAESVMKIRHISGTCLGRFKHSGGFQWRYEFLGDKIDPVTYDTSKIAINRKRRIVCFKDGVQFKEFINVAEARKWLGLKTNANISACLNGRAKSAYGYTWFFV